MKIGIYGLGYVGAVTAACLAHDGHDVVGVDPNPVKADLIMSGKAPVIEDTLEDLIASVVGAGKLTASTDERAGMEDTDIAFIAVGTPSRPNGSIDLAHVRDVAGQIGGALRERRDRPVIALRSTVLPGTTRETLIPLLEEISGKQAGVDFGVCFVPEFLREGVAVPDYYNPARVVIAASDEESGKTVASVFEHLDAPIVSLDFETAEMVKYVDNAWHALKVGFANEVGRLGRIQGIDATALMDVFLMDRKLNISGKYLMPGGPFGGSCLPKDLRALSYHARRLDVDAPILSSILPSNDRHVADAFRLIVDRGNKRVGMLGLSFKHGTDDVRESPMVELVERLIGKGFDVRIFDPLVRLATLVGANRQFLLEQLPHVSSLLVPTIEDVVEHAETLVIGNGDPQFGKVVKLRTPEQPIVDLAGLAIDNTTLENYYGICW